MSHLISTVNNSSYSSIGLEDISDVNFSSLSSNNILKYNSTNSKYENFQNSDEDNRGASFGYATTSPGVGGNANVYHPVNLPFMRFYYYGSSVSSQKYFQNTNYTMYPTRASSGFSYLSGIYVPAGTHKVKCSIQGNYFTSSSECVFRFCRGPAVGTAPTTSNTSFVGPHFNSAIIQGRFSSIPMAVITTTGSTEFIGLRCVSATSVSLTTSILNAVMHIETL